MNQPDLSSEVEDIILFKGYSANMILEFKANF